MSGLVSYGAYIPFTRVARSEIAAAWGGFKAPGEKAVANYDEDSLTMAVAAAMDCVNDIDIETIDGLYFATTTAPYKEKQSAATVATILGLPRTATTMDFSGSLRCGMNAVKAAMDAVSAGSARNILVCAADVRLGHPQGAMELNIGDGAAALLIGKDNVTVEIKGSISIHNECQDWWRSDQDKFLRSAEDRFAVQEGYTAVVAETIKKGMTLFGTTPKDYAKAAITAPNMRVLARTAGKLGFDPKTQILDNVMMGVGDTGSALALMSLVAALETTSAGDRILLAGHGNGCDVIDLEVTDNISGMSNKRGIRKHLESKMMTTYNKYLRWRELVDVQPPARPPVQLRQPSPSAQWRENQWELRLTGTRCTACGTAQYPPQRICMKCKEKDQMERYSYLDKQGKITSFSHDHVMETLDPPVTITVTDFEGGGRIMCDMTDRVPEDVEVGMNVEMTFRKLYYVGGIYNYWWKARPIRC